MREAVRDKDAAVFRQCPVEMLDDLSSMLIEVVEAGFEDAIRVYQDKFTCWAWVIKNCFTIDKEHRHMAPRLMELCPPDQKPQVVATVRDYNVAFRDGIDGMAEFVETHKEHANDAAADVVRITKIV